MSFLAVDLLQRLASAGIGTIARAVGIAPAGPAPADAAKQADFQALLKQAQQGAVPSGRAVNISARVPIELTPEQLQRIGRIADRAEASGLSTALVLIDGQALTLDVQSRTVTGRYDSTQPRTGQFDAVFAAPGENDPVDAPILPVPSVNLSANPTLAALLASLARGSRSNTSGGAAPATVLPSSRGAA